VNMRASLLFVRKGTRRRRNFCNEIAFETGYVSRVVTLRRLLLYRPRSPAVVIDTDLRPAKRALLLTAVNVGWWERSSTARAYLRLAHHKLPTQLTQAPSRCHPSLPCCFTLQQAPTKFLLSMNFAAPMKLWPTEPPFPTLPSLPPFFPILPKFPPFPDPSNEIP